MRTDGYGRAAHLSVCLFLLQLTLQLFVRPRNDTTYSARKENQFKCGTFPEMVVFELEKVAFTPQQATWLNPSISVVHAYLYAYSAGKTRDHQLAV